MDTFFIITTWGGSVLILGPISLVIGAILYFYGRIRDVFLILGGLGGSMILTHILKLVIARPRPPAEKMLIPAPSDFSFPSGHTSQATALAVSVLLIFLTDVPKKWRGAFFALLVVFAMLVGFSRVYLGVHYFSDVIAGALIGLVWTLTLFKAINTTIRGL